MTTDDARTPNRLREAREVRGLSQLELAAAAGLSRQSISAIEAGRATPAVDVALRLAKAVGRSVENLFGDTSEHDVLLAEAASSPAHGRLALAHIGGRWVAHGLGPEGLRTSADALAGGVEVGGTRAEMVRPESDVQSNVLVMGCAAALGILTDRLSGGAGRFVWIPGSSTRALEALAKNQTHLAGVHLVDGKTGGENVADVGRIVHGTRVLLVTLGRWEVGLLAARGSSRVRSRADLRRRGLRLAVREKGSGARRVLERELRAAGASVTLSSGVPTRGHLEVAQAVALGAADTGVATRDAAIAFGLDFVPLAEERYDLVLRADVATDPHIERLLDGLCSAGFRRELSSLGYDVRSSGDRVAEVFVS